MTAFKVQDLASMWNVLMKIKNSEAKVSPKFAYASARNLERIKSVIDEIELAQQPNPRYVAYSFDLEDLAKRYAKKDEEGNPAVVNRNGKDVYDIDVTDEYRKEYESLTESYKDAFDGQKEVQERVLSLLKEEREVELYKVILDVVPEITVQDIEVISPMIIE